MLLIWFTIIEMKQKSKIVITILITIFSIAGLEWRHYKKNEGEILRQYHYARVYSDVHKKVAIGQLERDVSAFIEIAFPPLPAFGGSDVKIANTERSSDSESIIEIGEVVGEFPILEATREVWAKYFYSIGIYLYEQEHTSEAEFFLASSAKISPYWSWFWVELGNYYALMGEVQTSKEVGQMCMGMPAMRDHCGRYFDDQGNVQLKNAVGFLKEDLFRFVK
jgi:hypothetical protein